MVNIFKISEMVDLGIEKEKQRRNFYDIASKRFIAADIRGLFEKLRDWEETHVKTFVKIRESLVSDEVEQTYPGELSEYMHAVVNERLYQSELAHDFEKKVTDIGSVIQYAIEFEKDAILFFNELLTYTVEGRKDAVLTIINEEKMHIVYLMQLREKLKKDLSCDGLT